jgi:predicted solute-binding protein
MAGDDQPLFITDLSRRWFDIHGLPFVFARWVVRKDASDVIKSAISDWLDEFKAREPSLVEQAVPEAAGTLNIAPAIIRRYFQLIRRSLDEQRTSAVSSTFSGSLGNRVKHLFFEPLHSKYATSYRK